MRSINEHNKRNSKQLSIWKMRSHAISEKAKAPERASEDFKRIPYNVGKVEK